MTLRAKPDFEYHAVAVSGISDGIDLLVYGLSFRLGTLPDVPIVSSIANPVYHVILNWISVEVDRTIF